MHRSCGSVAIKTTSLFIVDFSGLFTVSTRRRERSYGGMISWQLLGDRRLLSKTESILGTKMAT